MTVSGPPEAEETILAETLYTGIHLFINSLIYSDYIVLMGKGISPGWNPSLEPLMVKTTCEKSDNVQTAKSFLIISGYIKNRSSGQLMEAASFPKRLVNPQ